MLDARKLRTLAHLDRLGTIAAVAAHLQMTPPGVSMQLAALEREAGLPLTERRGRRVVLTAAGRVLARHGHDLADMVAVAEMELEALREGRTGTYRIAAYPTAARSFVACAWGSLLNSSDRGLALHVVECEPQDALPALSEGAVDLAVSHSYSNVAALPSPALVAAALAVENVLLAVPAGPTAGAESWQTLPTVALADYAHHDWVLPHPLWTCHEMVHRACAAAGFAPRSVAEATDYAVQLALVGAGVCVALVPQLGCIDVPAGVQLRRLEEPVRRTSFTVTRSSSRADPGLLHVRQLLEQAVAAAGTLSLDVHD
ncbi:MAG: LysR family transcriptional regulator [Frankiales bacterium]|nr:LysR family transcriptional regulator [Frankiales bacterium]